MNCRFLYFNFLYAPDGGGYQNSISFLKTLLDLNYDFINSVAIVYKNSGIHEICKSNGIKCHAVKKSLFSKILFEVLSFRLLNKGDIVFSIFGPPLLFSEKKTLNVGGMAISNVLYEDIDFWSYLPFFKKIIKRIKDRYRVLRYSGLDVWIFETDILKKRAISQLSFPAERCFVVKMSPSVLVSPDNVKQSCLTSDIREFGVKHKFLFLSSAHPNKRLHVLPELAKSLRSLGLDFVFIFTAQPNDYLSKVFNHAKRLGVLECFHNVGQVSAKEVASVVSCCDYMCTFSVLESFSNNFVEAWIMKKPLFVTDADWSRDSCRQGAIYLQFDEIDSTAAVLYEAVNSSDVLETAVKNGENLLDEYPSAITKTNNYLRVIERSMELGKRE